MKALKFRVSGIPVRVEPIFFLLLGFLALAWGFTGVLIPIFMVIAALSVLIHELGHATAERSFGAHPTITLHGFGATRPRRTSPEAGRSWSRSPGRGRDSCWPSSAWPCPRW